MVGGFDSCEIMGVNVANVNMDTLIPKLQQLIRTAKGEYVCATNVHTIVTAYHDPHYLAAQNSSILTFPDGAPVAKVAKNRGYNGIARTAGPDVMEEIFRISVKNGYRHFFYGSTPETLANLSVKLKERYPGINIVGMISPPFGAISTWEDKPFIDRINAAKPDIVWVGLGAPKQELWMYEHRGKIQSLMIGVGAGFDFHAGTVRRAPQWMQRHGLELLYRLFSDPKRLAKRYFSTIPCYIWHAMICGE